MQVPHIIVQERNDYDILSPTSIREGTRISTPEPTLFFFASSTPLTHSSIRSKTTGVGNGERENQPQRTHTHISLSLSLERTQKRPESSEGDTITMVCYQILGGCPFTRCLFKGKNGGLAPFDSTRSSRSAVDCHRERSEGKLVSGVGGI